MEFKFKYKVYKISEEKVTSFSQFISVKRKKMIRFYVLITFRMLKMEFNFKYTWLTKKG